ncbi:MAG: hypothetical protein H7X94_03695 [Vallitaleaceae bacterium]|nr:hypothetical protein [Vallitaleaceae bacterium]
MKLLDLVIVFVLITFSIHFATEMRTNHLEQLVSKKIEMNHILDTAVEDGVSALVEKSEGTGLRIQKERGVETFYRSLFLNFGITEDPHAKAKIKGYIPVIAIIDYDGIYLYSQETFSDAEGYAQLESVWQPKVTYTHAQNQYLYGFTLDDWVTVFDTTNGLFYEGKQGDLKEQIPATLLQDEVVFDEVRRRTITETLQNEINEGINHHNEVAKQYGITYQFLLPVIEDEDWSQCVDDLGMIAFFQGMPLGQSNEHYNDFALGGAQLYKKVPLFVQTNASSGLNYYHRQDCSLLTDKSKRFNKPKDCALTGAFPCASCKP